MTWISASEAAGLLGVSRSTLYAYVSRGRIRSQAGPGPSRQRRYSRDDVEQLRARTDERRNPQMAAEKALRWGLPVLESSITLIADGGLYYRGYDAVELARGSPLTAVASLIWNTADPPFADSGTRSPRMPAPPRSVGMPFIERAQATLALASARDPAACDLRAGPVARTGWRLLQLMVSVATGRPRTEATLDAALAASWGVPRSARLLRAALILCADHELNVSAFTARCVASAGSSPYAVVIAGLAALEGAKHGGTTGRIEALWDSLRRSRDLRGALAGRLRRGEPVDGFGHPLYPAGDPRARALLAMLPRSAESAFARRLCVAAGAMLGEAPTVDFALVAIARALRLPDGSALALFAIGRTIGWIGHALEQYEKDTIIRPRARYVGRMPRDNASSG